MVRGLLGVYLGEIDLPSHGTARAVSVTYVSYYIIHHVFLLFLLQFGGCVETLGNLAALVGRVGDDTVLVEWRDRYPVFENCTRYTSFVDGHRM